MTSRNMLQGLALASLLGLGGAGALVPVGAGVVVLVVHRRQLLRPGGLDLRDAPHALVVGLALGAALAAVIRSASPIDAAIPSWAVLAALAGSALTGMLFGMVPAIRAARLDPVEALRYE